MPRKYCCRSGQCCWTCSSWSRATPGRSIHIRHSPRSQRCGTKSKMPDYLQTNTSPRPSSLIKAKEGVNGTVAQVSIGGRMNGRRNKRSERCANLLMHRQEKAPSPHLDLASLPTNGVRRGEAGERAAGEVACGLQR